MTDHHQVMNDRDVSEMFVTLLGRGTEGGGSPEARAPEGWRGSPARGAAEVENKENPSRGARDQNAL